MFGHILKFVGLLVLLSFLSMYIPFGACISSIVVLIGLWKLCE